MAQVISRRGKLATVRVALWSTASYAFTGVALALMAQTLGAYMRGVASASAWYWWIGAALGAAVASAAGAIITGEREALIEERKIRSDLLESLYSSRAMAIRDDEDFQPAQFVALLTDNAERATQYLQSYLGTALAAFAVPFLTIGYIAAAVDLLLGIGMLGGFVAVPVILVVFMKFFHARGAASRNQRAKLSSKYLDAIRNLTTVSLLSAGARVERELRDEGERNRGAIMKILAGNQLVIIVVDLSIALFILTWSLWLLAVRASAGAVSMEGALATVFLLILIVAPVTIVAGFMYVGIGGIAAQKAISRYLATHGDAEAQAKQSAANRSDSEADIADLTRCGEHHTSPHAAVKCSPDWALHIEGMSHSYGEHKVITHADLKVHRGSKVAIVGASGCGKSTLMNVLRGLLPLQNGRAHVNGEDLSTASAHTIRQASAHVAQRTWLFTGTIADNLRLACDQASEAEMWDALKLAHLDSEVKAMPHGLNTDVGERGSYLSGGQAQRLALARAFLSGRSLLLLDEATSQVDLESEKLIVEAIRAIPDSVTVLMVTHRKALLTAADAVYEMRDGQLWEVQ